MKFVKKTLLALLVICLISTLLPATAQAATTASGTCGDNATWKLTSDGVLTISGTGAINSYSIGASPWYDYRASITSIVVNSGITSIGFAAFDLCHNATSISIPNTVTNIETYAMAFCYSLTSVTIPDSVKTIGASAFANCYDLADVHIGSGVSTIYGNPFNKGGALVTITVSENNPYFKAEDNVLLSMDGTRLICCGTEKSGKYAIPETVTTLEEYAFYYCSQLTGITIPESITTIPANAFYYCRGLTGITLPAGITTLGNYAFGNCGNLANIVFEGDAPSINSNSFYSVTANAYYMADTEGWTEDVTQNYGGTLTWAAHSESGGHYYALAVTDPTCAEGGHTVYTCNICGYSYTGDYLDANGHSYSTEWSVDSDSHWHTCSVCGETTEDEAHSFDNGFCAECDTCETAPLNSDGNYEISNEGQLYWFAALVNGGKASASAVLTDDIVLNTGLLTDDGSLSDGEFRSWTPIGSSTVPYTGSFDGQGHTISGLYVHGSSYIGLFGATDTGCTLTGITLEDVYVVGTTYVGALGGYIGSTTLTDCSVSGTVIGSGVYVGGITGFLDYGTTQNCHNACSVTGSANYVGGIAGVIRITDISGCGNSGTIFGKNSYVGGIAGEYRNGTIKNCWNTGDVSCNQSDVGGILGATSLATVSRCYNTGYIRGIYSNHYYSGGVVGRNKSTSTITNCWNSGTVSGYGDIGGITGYNEVNCKIKYCYSTGKISGSLYKGGIIGFTNGTYSPISSYYLTGTASYGVADDFSNTGAAPMTEEQFASGEVAYLLQKSQSTQIWGQNLDNGQEVQTAPVISSATVYYVQTGGCTEGTAQYAYSNFEETTVTHSYESVVTEATCTEEGCTTHTCTVCGDSYTDSYTDPLGHAYENGFCAECGEQDPTILLGDLNGDGEIDLLDANLIVSYYNGTVDLTEEQLLAADLNGDGEIDLLDANLIVSWYNGTIDSFPVEQ